jgi:hypothetical protein
VPFCSKPTVGPGARAHESANVGTACHIYSASVGGPRGTGGLSATERQQEENGIWCCAYHGRLIDTNRGDRYPAELLKHWKELHKARTEREMAGFATQLGWVHELEIINSVLFRPSSKLQFSKATLIYGDGPVGKSTICEWLAGISLPSALARWKKHDHDLRLSYFAPEAETILLSITKKEVHRSLNGKRLLKSPANLRVLYLPEDHPRRFRREPGTDDLSWIAGVLDSEPETIKGLCDDIRIDGHAFCRHMEFRDEHAAPNEEEDEPGRDGCYLYVAADTDPTKKLPLAALATSEEIAVIVQFAAALARTQARHTPTLLVLDAGGWNWCDSLFDYFAPYFAEQPYQVVLARAEVPKSFGNDVWAGWSAVQLERGKNRGDNTITEVLR